MLQTTETLRQECEALKRDLLEARRLHAAVAVENGHLREEVSARARELAEALQQQVATSAVLKVISRSTLDLKPVFDIIVETAASLCDADMAVVRLLKDGFFHHAATSSRNNTALSGQWRDQPVLPVDRTSIAGRVGTEGRAIHVHDVTTEPGYSYLHSLGGSPVRTALGVPLLQDGNVIGVIVLLRKRVDPYLERQVELVESFADQAVIAIENVRLFNEVQARTNELARSLDELRGAQNRLVQTEKLASLGQLTAGIAHEIKNPLNFVNNFSSLSVDLIDELRDLLGPAPLDQKMREGMDELTRMLKGNLEKVVQHGKRADSIVKNMLLHSREGSGERRPVRVNALVEESMNLAYHGARAEKPGFNATLVKELDPSAGEADLYPQEITRVLLNLISNGFYATSKRKAENGDPAFEPTVVATTRDLGDRVEIRIRDNGTGIPEEVRAKMFNPFFTTKPAGEGTGLGLSLSQDIIVKQHGGMIDVATSPGAFTEFKIVLPRGSPPRVASLA